MPDWRVPLADVVVPERDIDVVADVYRSGWLSMGPRTAEFEQALAEYTGAQHAFAVANGTAALHLICLAVGLGPSDEVIAPSMTFVASVNAIAYTGAQPVFADIGSLREPWITAETVEAALTPRTRAVMVVAYGGHPGEIEALRALCEERGIAPAGGRGARDRMRVGGAPPRDVRRGGRVLVLLQQEPRGRRGRRRGDRRR